MIGVLETMTHHSSSLNGSTRELGLPMMEEVGVFVRQLTTLSILNRQVLFSLPP